MRDAGEFEPRLPARGAKSAANAKGANSQNETEQADAFIDDTAKKTGKGRSTIARKAARAKVVVLPEIIGTPLDKGAEIDALAKLPVEKQRKALGWQQKWR
jgi:hypothetical protein